MPSMPQDWLQEIAAVPNEDGPRLAFAEWLENNGHPDWLRISAVDSFKRARGGGNSHMNPRKKAWRGNELTSGWS